MTNWMSERSWITHLADDALGWKVESGCRREQAQSSVLEASTVAAAASRWRKQAVTALQDAEEVTAATRSHTQVPGMLAALMRWACAANRVTLQPVCLPKPASVGGGRGGLSCAPACK